MKTKPQGKGIVKALHQSGTTGNFAKIAKAKGKGAAIGALQNKLAKVRGKKAPFGGKHKKHKSTAEEFKNSFKKHKMSRKEEFAAKYKKYKRTAMHAPHGQHTSHHKAGACKMK